MTSWHVPFQIQCKLVGDYMVNFVLEHEIAH